MFKEQLDVLKNQIAAGEFVEDDMEFLDTRLQYFPKYVESVVNYINTIDSGKKMLITGRIDQEEYQYRITNVDTARNKVHEMVIVSCNQINRLCNTYGLKHICPEDEEPRELKANFAAALTMELFMTVQDSTPSGVRSPEAIDEVVNLILTGKGKINK